MKKLFFTFFALVFTSIPIEVFAALGDSGEPAESCQAILDTNPSASDGEYYLQTTSMGAERKMYCNMTDAGGAWMLLFQRRGVASNLNTESCGTHLNNFLQNPCGDTANLAYGDSYSSDVDLTLSQFDHTEYMILQENSSGVKDNDDNFIIHSEQNIFPNSDSGQNNFNVNAVCDSSNTNCDSSDVKWIYVGTSWFNSALCLESNYAGSTALKGNYGYCHNGYANYGANSLFGNRQQYGETKLWQHNNGAKNYMERVYIRYGNIPPKNLTLSNTDIPAGSPVGSIIGTVSATDDNGDTLTYSFTSGSGDDDNASFSLSGSTLTINTSPDPNVKDTYYIRLRAIDGGTIPVEKNFIITVTGGTYLGSQLNPGSSCQAIKNARPSSVSGYFYVKTAAMPSSRHMYCDMETAGGGWMMLFQRRGGSNSTEECGTHLNNFLQNSCGSVYDIAYNSSYSSDVDLTLSQFSAGEYLVTQENNAGVVDTDDAYILHTSNNIFPNSDTGQNNFNINQICDINNANCDSTDVKWIYVGTSWFNSSRCLENNYNGSTTYKGNYGYCPNGWGSYGSNGLFGNRSSYAETKLWSYPPASAYMERVYVRDILNDTTHPVISSFTPGSGSLFPSRSPAIIYNHSDLDSGIDTTTTNISIQKWNGSSWGSDISGAVITSSGATGTGAVFDTLFPSYGKYQINYSVSDYVGNTQSQSHILYIDEPSFEVSTPEVDLGILGSINESYSSNFTVTVKTLGAGFKVYLKKNTDPNFTPFGFIPAWSAGIGYGYHGAPYSSGLSPFLNSPPEIFSQVSLLNTDGEKNTYSYDIRLGGKISPEQEAGDYTGAFDVSVVYDY